MLQDGHNLLTVWREAIQGSSLSGQLEALAA
jgi:hypothetical protein